MKTKAIHINAETQSIREITVDGLEDMQRAVNGLIELAFQSETDEGVPVDLYINEEGAINGTDYGFALISDDGRPMKYYGNGLICGADLETGDRTDSPVDLETVKGRVLWCASKERMIEQDIIKNNRMN